MLEVEGSLVSPVSCALRFDTPVYCTKKGLLSFKAGKMEVADKGNDVYHITPNLRKGTISLFKGQDDQLMHFSWKERPSGTVVDVSSWTSTLSRFGGAGVGRGVDGEKGQRIGGCELTASPSGVGA